MSVDKEDLDRLRKLCEELNVGVEDLDEVVHSVASEIASDVNNGGVEEQLYYLIDRLGAGDAEAEIHKACGSDEDDDG